MIKTRFYDSKHKQADLTLDSDSPLIPLALIVATYSPQTILKSAEKILHPAKKEKEQIREWETYNDFLNYHIPDNEEIMALCTPPVDDFSDMLI